MKRNVLLLSVLALPMFYASASATMPGNFADATRYDVTIRKIELCESSACNSPYVAASLSGKIFDIASVGAGSSVGSLVDLKSIPLYRIWSHVRVTLAPYFAITATGTDDAANTCWTNSANTASSHTALGVSTTGGGGPATAQTLYVPNVNAFGASVPSSSDYSSYGVSKTDNSDVVVTYALTAPYVCKGVMPTITVKFDTKNSIKFYDSSGGGGATCTSYPAPPTVTITASD
ncbi:MAG: hypothetical protein OEL53_06025 [Rhodospirillales bacterium]|nr:hypothetical protein [Rhodospirillales bacterium]